MRIVLAIVFVLFSTAAGGCQRPPPPAWHGIPDGPRTCGHDRGGVATCVVAGAAYVCPFDYVERRYDCARLSPLATPERP